MWYAIGLFVAVVASFVAGAKYGRYVASEIIAAEQRLVSRSKDEIHHVLDAIKAKL